MIEASPTDVSVIIVNWNTSDLLRQCLHSVFAQTSSIECEVIVVDNGSTDGSVEMVRQEFPRVNLLANYENRGFAAANNQGIAIANRYVLLLNSDTIVLDRAIERTIAFADDHSDTAVTGCRVLNSDRSLQYTCFMFPSILNSLLLATFASTVSTQWVFWARANDLVVTQRYTRSGCGNRLLYASTTGGDRRGWADG